MTYPEVLDYLYSCLPMFHRVGAVAYKANLDNTHHLMELLDHPEQGFRSVHVAGTNGKGSSSHMLAAVLQAAGYKTGLYTSPHLLDFRERIRVNGGMVPEEVVTGFVQAHRAAFDRIQPSFFEWTVALAFDYFRNEQVDIAIIETGLGGRLDSTNVITPEVALITNIGWDHMNLLGDTLEKIAAEKAGIIKPGVPVIISEGQLETIHVLTSAAQRAGSNSCVADQEYKVEAIGGDGRDLNVSVEREGAVQLHYTIGLPGRYQTKNVAGVLATIYRLREMGWKIPEAAVARGLRDVRSLTGLMGRWQLLKEQPKVIADVGHNLDGIREILLQLEHENHTDLHWVIGVVEDKDLSGILPLLPAAATYYCCKPDLPRGRDAASLCQALREHGLRAEAYPSVAMALASAMRSANERDLILIAGSTFVVAEAMKASQIS